MGMIFSTINDVTGLNIPMQNIEAMGARQCISQIKCNIEDALDAEFFLFFVNKGSSSNHQIVKYNLDTKVGVEKPLPAGNRGGGVAGGDGQLFYLARPETAGNPGAAYTIHQLDSNGDEIPDLSFDVTPVEGDSDRLWFASSLAYSEGYLYALETGGVTDLYKINPVTKTSEGKCDFDAVLIISRDRRRS